MTTIGHVRGCQPHTMVDLADTLTTQNDTFSAEVEKMDRDVDTAMNGWKGNAATAASVRAVADKLAGDHIGAAVVTLADTLDTFGAELDGYRTAMLNIVDNEVPAAGMKIDDQGNVTAPAVPAGAGKNAVTAHLVQQILDAQASGFQSRVKNLLTEFADAETKAAQAITTGLQDLGTYERTPDGPPVSNAVQAILDGKAQLPTDPKQLHDFWNTLTPAEKDALYQHDHAIGNTDGIPQTDRDHYNRMHLAELQQQTQDKLDQYKQKYGPIFPFLEKNTDTADGQQVHALETQLAGYTQVSNQLAPQDGIPRYLSVIDTHGRGAIALNNPDTAQNVATYVPGTGSNLTNIDEGVSRAEAMRRAAMHADPSKTTSVVTWYGYNAPQAIIPDAASPSWADHGANALDGYQSGLRATHVGPPALDTVIGHSYGTTTIGHAASNGHTLDTDNVVLVASPGIGVNSPDQLSLTSIAPGDVHNHLFSTTAQYDPIRLVGGPLGKEPVDTPGFGNTFHASPDQGPWYKLGWNSGAHGSYWDRGNPALTSMGNIIAGKGVS
jgi:hypothetical protein